MIEAQKQHRNLPDTLCFACSLLVPAHVNAVFPSMTKAIADVHSHMPSGTPCIRPLVQAKAARRMTFRAERARALVEAHAALQSV